MDPIRGSRVLAGGAVSAIVLFMGAGIVNGAVLGEAWNAWLRALGPLSHAPSNGVGMVLWVIVSLVFGITGTGAYAAVRPRFDGKWRAALATAAGLWASGWLTSALGQIALGAVPTRIVVVDCVGGAASAVLAMLAGAAVYG